MIDLNEKLKEALAFVDECEKTLVQMKFGYDTSVKNQRRVISMAKSTAAKWKKLVDKANEISDAKD